MATDGLKVRVVTGAQGIRVQYVPIPHAGRGKAVRDVAVATDVTAVQIQVVAGSGDPTCLQWAKVDAAGNAI